MPSSEHDEGLNVESMPALAVHPSPGSGEGAAPPLFRSPSGMSAQANYFAQNMFNLHFRKRMRLALQHHTWRMCKKLRGNMPVDMDTLEDELTHKNRDMTAGQAAARSVTPQQAEALGCKLLQACREGSYKEVQKHLSMGADANWHCPPKGTTPLMAAAESGNANIVKKLLSAGADCYQYDEEEGSALMCACTAAKVECVRVLLKDGEADAFHTASTSGRNALLEAAASGCCESLGLLVELGGGGVAETIDENTGDHALLEAARKGHLSAVKTLMSLGAKVSQTNKKGETALSSAARNGDSPMIQYLLRKGSKMIPEFGTKITPLMIAARGGYCEAVHLLLKQCNTDDIAAHDADGKTALQLAGRHAVRDMIMQAVTAKKEE